MTTGFWQDMMSLMGIQRKQRSCTGNPKINRGGLVYGILTGAQIVIECPKEQGVDTVFGYRAVQY